MIEWTQHEQAALHNFIATPGPLRDGLQRYTEALMQHYQEQCSVFMATPPRNIEAAADCAAKAQVLHEFFSILMDHLKLFETPSEEPTLVRQMEE